MARKPTRLKADARYEVTLARPIRIGRTVLRPCDRVVLDGAAAEEHRDDILEVRPVAS